MASYTNSHSGAGPTPFPNSKRPGPVIVQAEPLQPPLHESASPAFDYPACYGQAQASSGLHLPRSETDYSDPDSEASLRQRSQPYFHTGGQNVAGPGPPKVKTLVRTLDVTGGSANGGPPENQYGYFAVDNGSTVIHNTGRTTYEPRQGHILLTYNSSTRNA
ncbi:MAG: hypothetical protein M1829_001188 [Trizodia sp. TS-e1964]|nr:MAG: hypothetical protein M1829_001188 [Trizodia sp. TS-e1964]